MQGGPLDLQDPQTMRRQTTCTVPVLPVWPYAYNSRFPRQQFIAEAGTKAIKMNRASILLLIAALAVTGCRRTPEAKMAKFLTEGEKQLEKKDYPRAILQFRNAVQSKPNEAEPY
jgi:hypothetical protein